MPNDRIAVAFMNGIGNFIFFTSAVKILKEWGYEHIDLITDPKFLRSTALMDLAGDHFERIRIEFDVEDYDRIFVGRWSEPMSVHTCVRKIRPEHKFVNWHFEGIHEVQEYLDMIGASWQDFSGYLFKPSEDVPLLKANKPKIALANCSSMNQALKKRWNGFPELSVALEEMGYDVILLGVGSELEGCVGRDFRDQLSIHQTGGILAQCDLLIGVSTGLTVVADAVGTPVLLIEGPMPTFKSHPLLSKFRIVRKYISCAPCWQKSLWHMCNEPTCMDSINVGDVVQEMLAFQPEVELKKQNYYRFFCDSPDVNSERLECNSRMAYIIPCYNRYHRTKEFFEDFSRSHPQKGTAFVLNDASSDPRISDLINGMEIPDVEVDRYDTDIQEKVSLRLKFTQNPSVHAYNRLIKAILDRKEDFDYAMILDPDAIMKSYWVQRLIKIHEIAVKEHPKVGLASPFNADHRIYDELPSSKVVHETPYGGYRVRLGVNAAYLMTMKFLIDVHQYFDPNVPGSADYRKQGDLTKKGYVSICTVPSLLQHGGAFETSYYKTKITLAAEDFDEPLMSDLQEVVC